MNPEIENLINMALADGEVTEKERAIILKKADALDLDVDEVEMILDGRIALIVKENTTEQIKSNKEGNIKKCPSCGFPVTSFSIKCTDCGHEFNNSKGLSSKERLFQEFSKIEKELRSQKRSAWAGTPDLEIMRQQASLLSSFPIPNNKEDILDFFNQAIHESNKEEIISGLDPLKKAWKIKSLELRSKIKLNLSSDQHALILIKEFDKENSKIRISNHQKVIFGFFLFCLLALCFGYFASRNADNEILNEKNRLELVLKEVNNLIFNKNYELAKIKATSLKWQVKDSWSGREKQLIPLWDQQREEILNIIEESKKKQ